MHQLPSTAGSCSWTRTCFAMSWCTDGLSVAQAMLVIDSWSVTVPCRRLLSPPHRQLAPTEVAKLQQWTTPTLKFRSEAMAGLGAVHIDEA